MRGVLRSGRGPEEALRQVEVPQIDTCCRLDRDDFRKCNSEGCQYETACKRSFAVHKQLSACRPENLKRLGRPQLSAQRATLVEVLTCSKDGFQTVDGQVMAAHSLKCGAEVTIG